MKQESEYKDFVREIEDLESVPAGVPREYQNAIVINLFCIDENFESRSVDFIEYAFSLFPDKEYLILTQPYTAPEITLLQNFIQIPKKKNSTFDHVLYVLHKDYLKANSIFVRKSKLKDL